MLSLCCLVHEKAQRAHLATFLNLYYKDLEKEKQYQPSRYIFFSPKKIPSPNALKKVINACCLAPKKENLLLRIVRCTSLPTPYSFYANPTKKTQNSPTLEKKLLGIIK